MLACVIAEFPEKKRLDRSFAPELRL